MNTDIRVNLLPWRETLRAQRKQTFLYALLAALALAGTLVAGMDRLHGALLERQALRNDFLRGQAALLEARSAKMQALQARREELLVRMERLQQLAASRSLAVRVLDELARQLAPGVYFTSLEVTGVTLEVEGYAESNNGISDQLRRLEGSNWFTQPSVTAIVSALVTDGQQRRPVSQFSLTARCGREEAAP